MSGVTTARSNNSEKKKNKPLESVLLAEHELLKEKYETMTREHETLIKTLELIEKKHGFTLEDLEKKQRESVVAKEEVEKWVKIFGQLQKKLEKVEKDIEDMKSFDETEMNGVDSGNAAPAENLNVNRKTVSIGGVIEISDDDEENQSGSNRGHSNKEYYFTL
ncbi:uncharacterized protein LOC18030828 [Eutrema salsugineum]|uniref:uncharacterized protein LOC18030828 n=1 Tax=Eutrema salsugineum TaxID=72664 RepID=UPI000CECFFE3|nr:uncharacterized protein LOC18030828 [Eutrema salsugineum]